MRISFIIAFLVMQTNAFAQYKSFKLLENGDTINRLNNAGEKQGKWIEHVNALRLDPAYDEEGIYVNGKREGVWRRFDMFGLMTAKENYKWGQKHGLQIYLEQGQVEHEENWRAVDPNKKFDTVDVPDVYDPLIVRQTVVKVEGYSVPVGNWRYYEPETGKLIKTEQYNILGQLVEPAKVKIEISESDTATTPKQKTKPKFISDYEKTNKGRKAIKVRDGRAN